MIGLMLSGILLYASIIGINVSDGHILKERQLGAEKVVFIKEHYGNKPVEGEVYNILEELVKENNLALIGVERLTGDVSSDAGNISRGAAKLELAYGDDVITYGVEDKNLYDFTLAIKNLLTEFVETRDYTAIETIKHALASFEKRGVEDMFDGKNDLELIMKHADSIIVDKRSRAFIENLLERMHEAGLDMAALVAGGAHEESITSVLEEKGISYIIIEPNSYPKP